MNAPSPREVELKLEVGADDLPRLRSRLEARFGTATTSRLVSVYFDTPGQALRAAGVALRIRSDGTGALVQTVKCARGTGTALFDRDEWETPVAGLAPDLAAFLATPAGTDLGPFESGLEPVFETVVERSVWDVSTTESHVEIALDGGEVRAAGRCSPIHELELELKAGVPGDLFSLLGTLGDIGHLRPGAMTKSERGYRLLRGKTERACKAQAVRLEAQMSAGEAFGAIAQGCLHHLGRNVPLVVERRQPEGLHQARVALRRLRSALSLFRDVVADARYPDLKLELRDLSRSLGEARNLDVYLARHARPETEHSPDEPGVTALLADMERRRHAAYDDVLGRLASPAFGALMLRVIEWIEVGPWRTEPDPLVSAVRDRPIRPAAAHILDKRRRRVVHRGKHLAQLDPDARHRVRIEAKKLRYASEFFAALVQRPKARAKHEHFIAVLEELQEALGELNDIQTGHEIATGVLSTAQQPGGTAAAEVFAVSRIDGRQEVETMPLLQKAETAHAALKDAKRFWSKWRA